MKLNVAQEFVIDMCRLARMLKRLYLAPRAHSFTPAKKHGSRVGRKKRLFKGHRP